MPHLELSQLGQLGRSSFLDWLLPAPARGRQVEPTTPAAPAAGPTSQFGFQRYGQPLSVYEQRTKATRALPQQQIAEGFRYAAPETSSAFVQRGWQPQAASPYTDLQFQFARRAAALPPGYSGPRRGLPSAAALAFRPQARLGFQTWGSSSPWETRGAALERF